jgi:hypothetical protein
MLILRSNISLRFPFYCSKAKTLTDVEFECRKYRKTVSFEKYKTSQFCPDCDTFLQLRPQPRHWLFQFSLMTCRWLDRIKETKEPEQWLASQHSKQIREGDIAAIWGSGLKSGVYAIGQIITKPAKKPQHRQTKYFLIKKDDTKFCEKSSAIAKYSKVIYDKHLLHDEYTKDPILLEMPVLMNPKGTNFRLTTEQWNRIIELIEERLLIGKWAGPDLNR